MKQFQIIHIDDNVDDALLLSLVLGKCEKPISHEWFSSATTAIGFLGNASDAQMPDLIFCDLRMPDMSGHDFIRWLRQSKWQHIPVVVLSGSEFEDDIRAAYALGANSFLFKPLAVDEILKLMEQGFLEHSAGHAPC